MQEPNHEALPVQPPEQTPAEQLGLPVDVVVRRTSGEIENGWTVSDFGDITNPKTNETFTVVRVRKLDLDNNQTLEKDVPLDTLRDWNSPPEEDTIPREHVISPTTAEAEVLSERSETAREVGKVAVDEVGTVEEVDIKPKTVDNSGLEQSPVEKSPENAPELVDKRSQAVLELQESWGLPEGETIDASIKQAANRLDEQMQKLEIASRTLRHLDDVGRSLQRQIHSSLDANKNLVTGRIRQEVGELLFGSAGFNTVLGMTSERQFLPASLNSKLEGFSRSLHTLRRDFDAMNAKGPNFIDTDAAYSLSRNWRAIPDLAHQVVLARRQVEEMKDRLVGYTESGNYDSEDAHYRNEQVRAWSEELEGNITPERVEEITNEMQAAVAIEARMSDDPKSPSRWFGHRVLNDGSKSNRESTHITGREPSTMSSQRYVAEIMSDLLTGKYNVQAGNSPLPIEIEREGSVVEEKVRSGVHRAAALAMLYGEEWPKVARSKGIKIDVV